MFDQKVEVKDLIRDTPEKDSAAGGVMRELCEVEQEKLVFRE